MDCPLDVNLAGLLDTFPEAWGSVGTEPSESILEGQMSLANSGWQPYFPGLSQGFSWASLTPVCLLGPFFC